MEEYNPGKIEQKWQERWEKKGIYKTKDKSRKPKFYVLDMFPYPSGEGLHVGHPKGYIATDVVARMKMLQGYNVLHPMGWDAFGLPAENYALQNKIHPKIAVQKNIKKFKKQIARIGFTYDWSKEINTTEPNYYKWTQWIFLQMFKKGLVERSFEPVNWCPKCLTVLAQEDLEQGRCERCGALVERKPMEQWVLKMTDYAERLLKDLKLLDWPGSIVAQQRNWIGKSCGAEIKFQILNSKFQIPVFTTRLDTIFGCTYMVVAPEHEIIKKLEARITNYEEVEKYIKQSKRKSDLERTDLIKEKTGIELKGIKAINPFNQEKIPVWAADYVLPHYGTGAIMAVPAYDERDLAFAKKYKLFVKKAALGNREKLLQLARKQGFGKKAVYYKMRDWVFSRQRYWGEPIPLVFCEKCGWQAVPEKDLPLKLPKVEHYEPIGTGESPLANIKKWVNTKCPKCKGLAKRETNTMPQWAGSCWYYLAYIMRGSQNYILDKKKIDYWLPIDLYVGGAEHATRHLLYARFWHKFLQDIKVVSQKEPFKKFKYVGLILAEDGRKMSKRWKNVINPDYIVEKYGADSLRLYEMFMGPFDQPIAWNEKGVKGVHRFLEKVWKLSLKSQNTRSKLNKLLHQTIKKVSEDIEDFKFNTAISQLMILVNEMEKQKQLFLTHYSLFLILLSPFAPHICEELWQKLGNRKSIFLEKWPKYSPKLIKEEKITLVIQINGKVRDKVEVAANISEKQAKELTLTREKVKKWIAGKSVKRIIFVPKRLINIVV